jgi:hypothetical protein
MNERENEKSAKAGAAPARRRYSDAVRGLLILGPLAATLLVVVGLGLVLGKDFGAPCSQGFFACKNRGFNDARCVMTSAESGYCSRLCTVDAECPQSHRCDLAIWTKNGVDTGNGRVERVCVPASRP